MTHELIKQLKDAGFPWKKRHSSMGVLPRSMTWDDQNYVPTLSELIKSCGEGIFYLFNSNIIKNGWHSQITNEKVELTHTVAPKVKKYELEQIVGLVAGIEREHEELLEKVADNRARFAQYNAIIPEVEIAIIAKEARIEAEELAAKEVIK